MQLALLAALPGQTHRLGLPSFGKGEGFTYTDWLAATPVAILQADTAAFSLQVVSGLAGVVTVRVQLRPA